MQTALCAAAYLLSQARGRHATACEYSVRPPMPFLTMGHDTNVLSQAIALFRSLPPQAPGRVGVAQLLDHLSAG